MVINDTDFKTERAVMSDYWNFRKKYHSGEDRNEFWIELCDEADQISKKYDNLYVDMLLCVCANDIESRYYASKGRPVDSHLQLERAMKLYDTFVKRRKNDNGKSEM